MHRARLERQGEIVVAEKIGARRHIGQPVDIEGIAAKVHVESRRVAADRAGPGERTFQGRTVEGETGVMGGKSDAGDFDRALQRSGAIGKGVAEGGEAIGERGSPLARPGAQRLKLADRGFEPAGKLRRRAEIPFAFRAQPAIAGQRDLEAGPQGNAGREFRVEREIGDRLSA